MLQPEAMAAIPGNLTVEECRLSRAGKPHPWPQISRDVTASDGCPSRAYQDNTALLVFGDGRVAEGQMGCISNSYPIPPPGDVTILDLYHRKAADCHGAASANARDGKPL